jgi:hypothetical protein
MDIVVSGAQSPGVGPSAGAYAEAAPRLDARDGHAARVAVDRRLDELLPPVDGPQGLLVSAMRYALLAPGKRLRPLLTLAAARELGGEPADALDAGCALEMLHAASLVLDDLPCMDDAGLRRGRATTHVAFGEDVAILASIGLLGRAFAVVAAQRALPATVRGAVSAALAESIGADGLAAGQVEDLRGAAARASAADAQRCNLRKTGALFVAAVEIGAAVARAPAARPRARRRIRAAPGLRVPDPRRPARRDRGVRRGRQGHRPRRGAPHDRGAGRRGAGASRDARAPGPPPTARSPAAPARRPTPRWPRSCWRRSATSCARRWPEAGGVIDPWAALAIVGATLAATEALAWAVHRWVMHGPGWRWHRSHHEPEPGRRLETNDAYSVIASVAVTALFVVSGGPSSPWWWVGFGATLYGLLYAVVHDGWAHGRWPAGRPPRVRWIERLVQAHRLHHAVRGRDGAVAFGFLWAPAPERLARALRASGAARRDR